MLVGSLFSDTSIRINQPTRFKWPNQLSKVRDQGRCGLRRGWDPEGAGLQKWQWQRHQWSTFSFFAHWIKWFIGFYYIVIYSAFVIIYSQIFHIYFVLFVGGGWWQGLGVACGRDEPWRFVWAGGSGTDTGRINSTLPMKQSELSKETSVF